MTGITIYLRNLWLAVTGKDPYQLELDGVKEELAKAREELEKAVENARLLGELYGSTAAALKKDAEDIKDYQTLVENLRERIAEKDELIRQMEEAYRKSEKGYKERIADYGARMASRQVRERKKPGKKPKNER